MALRIGTRFKEFLEAGCSEADLHTRNRRRTMGEISMPLNVSFVLSDRDLQYFRRKMREATAGAKNRTEADIVASTRELLEEIRETIATGPPPEATGQTKLF